MFKKKCPSCGKKIEKKFRYCPYCGKSFRQEQEQEDFGMLGREDFLNAPMDAGFPLGLNRIMASLMKQIDKEFNELEKEDPERVVPHGFKIQISTGNQPRIERINAPMISENNRGKEKTEKMPEISLDEMERRAKLKKEEAKSAVRRLADRIVYEIAVPNVKSKKDIVVTKLENGIEIKAYSKDRCFYKVIPIKTKLMGSSLKEGILFMEFGN